MRVIFYLKKKTRFNFVFLKMWKVETWLFVNHLHRLGDLLLLVERRNAKAPIARFLLPRHDVLNIGHCLAYILFITHFIPTPSLNQKDNADKCR